MVLSIIHTSKLTYFEFYVVVNFRSSVIIFISGIIDVIYLDFLRLDLLDDFLQRTRNFQNSNVYYYHCTLLYESRR
jgi:hypothetical protein